MTRRHAQRVLAQVAQFQIDSVNVAVRAHYMPLFSRLGPYDVALLVGLTERPPRRAFEYWGHAASLIDVALYPALRFRMADAEHEAWVGIVRFQRDHPDVVEEVWAEVAARGPLTAREIERDEVRRRDHWGWNWSSVKTALEWLVWSGRVTPARRTASFERVYDLPERALPAAVVAAEPLDVDAAHEALIRRSAAALGVASARSLGDYFYLRQAPTRAAIARLVSAGELVPVEVDGVGPGFRWAGARRPRSLHMRALVSPFDSLQFQRPRLQRLFGVDYRIEIYVPAAQRRFGYYVYLFWLSDEVAARVDLKAERQAGVLRVQAAWAEPGCSLPAAVVARELAGELQLMAAWLGLTDVAVAGAGDLAPTLARALD